eukprot:232643_1
MSSFTSPRNCNKIVSSRLLKQRLHKSGCPSASSIQRWRKAYSQALSHMQIAKDMRTGRIASRDNLIMGSDGSSVKRYPFETVNIVDPERKGSNNAPLKRIICQPQLSSKSAESITQAVAPHFQAINRMYDDLSNKENRPTNLKDTVLVDNIKYHIHDGLSTEKKWFKALKSAVIDIDCLAHAQNDQFTGLVEYINERRKLQPTKGIIQTIIILAKVFGQYNQYEHKKMLSYDAFCEHLNIENTLKSEMKYEISRLYHVLFCLLSALKGFKTIEQYIDQVDPIWNNEYKNDLKQICGDTNIVVELVVLLIWNYSYFEYMLKYMVNSAGNLHDAGTVYYRTMNRVIKQKQYNHGIDNVLDSALNTFGAFDLVNASYPFVINSMMNTICAVQGWIPNNKRLSA